MWLARLIVLGFLAWAEAFQCGVNEEFLRRVQQNSAAGRSLQQDLSMQFQRSSTWGSLRIHVEQGDLTGLNVAQQTRLMEVILPAATAWFENMLTVKNVEGNVIVPAKKCGEMTVPLSHRITGVQTDYILYIYTRNDDTSEASGAGAACAFDGAGGNPVAGFVELNPINYKPVTVEEEIHVLRHMLTHALGFQGDQYASYRHSDGGHYSQPTVQVQQRGLNSTQLATPAVVLKAKQEFGCGTLAGVPLDPSEGLWSSHWSKRIMFNDYMTADLASEDVIYSDISLAVLEDSGWYQVNYAYTDPIYYGQGKGCSWFNSKCVVSGIAQFPEFCTAGGSTTCDFLGNRKGTCDFTTYASPVPTPFQYFAEATRGGADALADYCPYVEAALNGDCKGRGAETSPLPDNSFGEVYGDTSRCFTGDYWLRSVVGVSGVHAGCHPVRCFKGTAFVSLGSKEVACPVPGGPIYHEDYKGTITCPPYSVLCGRRPCINGCFGVGICSENGCACNDGYSGVDCSIKCSSRCRSCTGSTATQCSTCYSDAHVDSTGACVCDANYAFDSTAQNCMEIVCHPTCKTCVGTTSSSCTSCHENATLSPLGACGCDVGYYQTSAQTCAACDPTCLSCSGTSTHCTACPGNLALDSNACKCADGSNFDPYIQFCISALVICHNDCATCSGDASDECTSCTDHADLIEGSCECSDKYEAVYIENKLTCAYDCDPTCEECSGPYNTLCTQCVDPAMELTDGVCTCPQRYSFSATLHKCQQDFLCYPLCASCSGPNPVDCLSCPANFDHLANGRCSCSQGYYLNYKVCAQCDSTCLSCIGADADQCTSCQTYAAMASGVTVGPCSCLDGYFGLPSSCEACLSQCASCSNGQSCSTCKAPYATQTEGVCVCPSQQYLSADGASCLPCSANCFQCSDANTCTECFSWMLMSPSSPGQCICPEGQFLKSAAVCGACNASCQSCGSDPMKCMSCDTTVAMKKGTSCVCLSSAYLAISGGCRSCHPSCLTCSSGGFDQCLTCAVNAGLRLGKCICRYGYAQSADLRSCVKCDSACGSCDGPNASDCTSCKGNASLFPGTLSSSCNCDLGFYLSSDFMCLSCHSSCKACSGPSASQCTQCAAGLSLSGSSGTGTCEVERMMQAIEEDLVSSQ